MVSLADHPTTALLAVAGSRWVMLCRLAKSRAEKGGWTGPRWRAARWLALPVALPLFLVGGLATGTLVNLGLSGIGIPGAEGALLAPASAATTDAGMPAGVCDRMAYIVNTACALQQRDHDVEGTRQCVARELKYTMWSAYGCG